MMIVLQFLWQIIIIINLYYKIKKMEVVKAAASFLLYIGFLKMDDSHRPAVIGSTSEH